MTFTEEFKLTGEQIFSRIRELISEGNIRRLILKNSEGKVLLDTTVSIGAIGAGWLFVISPLLTTIAAIVLSLKDVTVVIERDKKDSDPYELV